MSKNLKSAIFTSESVGAGHPDKVCDQISDAILDAYLAADPFSRVACETVVKNNQVILAGEITSNAQINHSEIARNVIKEIGYNDPTLGFDSESCKITEIISQQSPDIKQGVDDDQGLHLEQGAGDQGLMFGFACNDTPELMPYPIQLSHQLLLKLHEARNSGSANFLKPDAKAQVSVCYDNRKAIGIDAIVISTQHTEEIDLKKLEEYLKSEIINQTISTEMLSSSTKYYINPTGKFIIGGPVGDCGLTGRKIIVDTYGGYSRHGGGAFSGKDPSKVDRSAAYMARYIAKNIVAAELANACEVQLAYAIGVASPVGVYVTTKNGDTALENKLAKIVPEIFNLTPKGIIDSLDLLKPIYQQTAAYGHFGRTPTDAGHFSWEKTDKIEQLKAAI